MLRPFLVKQAREKITQVGSVVEFGELLGESPNSLELLSVMPKYKIFEIPKPHGGMRLIEDPDSHLKKTLRKLNFFLQAYYHSLRPSSVYGFCIRIGDEEERNIVTNAARHLKNMALLKVDLKDFFHQVTIENVRGILEKRFKNMEHQLIELISRLTCFRGRLPMGAPTSPALSNMACLMLDAELEALTTNMGITYTRYADDMSFSCDKEIDENDVSLIKACIGQNGFEINDNKVKLNNPGEERMITGICLTETGVRLPSGYLLQLEEEIGRMAQTMAVEYRYRTGMSLRKLALFKQELQGKWNFANMVEPGNPEVEKLYEGMMKSFEAPEEFESVKWLDVPYGIF